MVLPLRLKPWKKTSLHNNYDKYHAIHKEVYDWFDIDLTISEEPQPPCKLKLLKIYFEIAQQRIFGRKLLNNCIGTP